MSMSPHFLIHILNSSSSCALVRVAYSPFVVHHLMSATLDTPSNPAMNAPVQCIPVTIIGCTAGIVKISPFLEQLSHFALLEITEANPSDA